MDIFFGVMIPFIGTSLGAAIVYLMKNNISSKIERIILGFASGVMIAASVWSLIIPALERSSSLGIFSWVPASIGFMTGIIFLIFLDILASKINKDALMKKYENRKSKMLFLAVTLHNIPEGMAVGTIFAAWLSSTPGVTLASAFALSIGIAIQNFPEGAMISMPIMSEGHSKNYAFKKGIISGIVEPIFAVITIILTNLVVPILPYLLSFAAGAMIYVVVHELIPDAGREENNLCPLGVAIGFTIMMILDVALS